MSAYNKITSVAIGGRGRSSSDTSAKISLFNFDFSFKKRASTSIKSSAAARGSTVGNETWTSESDGVGNSTTVSEEVPTTSSVNSRGQRKPSGKKSAGNDGQLERNGGQEQLPVSSKKKGKGSRGESLKRNQRQGQESLGQRERSSVQPARQIEEDRESDNETEVIVGEMTALEDSPGRSAKRIAQRNSPRKKNTENHEPLQRNGGQEQLPVISTKKGKVSHGKNLKRNQSHGQESPLIPLGQRVRSSVRRASEVEEDQETVESGVSDDESDAIARAMAELEDASGRSATSFVQRKSPQKKNTENDAPLRRNINHESLSVPSAKKSKVSYGKRLKGNEYQAERPPFRLMGEGERRSARRASEVEEDLDTVESGVSDNESDATASAMAELEDASGRSAKRLVQRKSPRKKNAENDVSLKRTSSQEPFPGPSAKKSKVNHGKRLKGDESQAQGSPFRLMGPRERRPVHTEVEAGRESVESGVSDNEFDAIASAMAELQDASGRSAKHVVQRKSPRKKNAKNDGNASRIQIVAQVSSPADQNSDVKTESEVTPEQICRASTSNRKAARTGTKPEIICLNEDSDVSADSDEEDDSNGESGDDLMPIYIHEEPEEYYKLGNAEQTGNLIMVNDSMAQNVAGFMEPNFAEAVSNEEYPGVQKSLPHKLNASFRIGYLKIAPQTVKPPEFCDVGKLVFWIIKGTVTVKSAGGRYHAQNNQYLFGKKLGAGACVVLPKNTVYIFENWGTTEALLSYNVMQE